MAQHKKKSSAKAGMLPGSAIYIGEHSPIVTKVMIHIYDSQNYHTIDGFDNISIQEALAAKKTVWVDITGLADHLQINQLCADLGIHTLTVEDILHTEQRAKVDVFDDYLFVILKLLNMPKERLTYSTEQFSLLVKNNLLMTFRETTSHNFTTLYQRLSTETSLIRDHGCDYLTYLVMDRIVDDYFDFVETATKSLEKLEDLLISDPDKICLKDLYTMKRRTLTLRNTFAPIRDVIHLLLKEHNHFIDEKYHIFYRDLYDHSIRLLESVNLHHDMMSGMLDLYLSTLNNRMNESVKVLTIFASLFIPLSFFTSLYGMNFKHMPELQWYYGYPILLTVMSALVAVMLYYFKRKKLF